MIYNIFLTKVQTFVFAAILLTGGQTLHAEQMRLPELKKILRDISTKKANCQREKCENLKLYMEYEEVLKSAIETQTKTDLVLEENQSLKSQAENLESKLTLPKEGGCDKARILKEKMIELGINKNGNLIYSKRPMGMEGSQCWSNGKKKKEATLTLCEFPLAINILSVGGDSAKLTERRQEYIFDLKGCNLVSVKISEETQGKQKAKVLTTPHCIQNWNKRTADAAMTKDQVRLMEETISQCFKYGLLPTDEPSLKSLNKSNSPLKKTQ